MRAFHVKGNSSYSIILLSVPLKKHNFSDILSVTFSYRKKFLIGKKIIKKHKD